MSHSSNGYTSCVQNCLLSNTWSSGYGRYGLEQHLHHLMEINHRGWFVKTVNPCRDTTTGIVRATRSVLSFFQFSLDTAEELLDDLLCLAVD